jgi:HSP20 family molecular chaperone IbpA
VPTLQPRRSLASLDPLSEALRRLEDRTVPQSSLFPLWCPDAEVEESAGRMVIRLGVPGVRREQVRVRVADDLLTVEAGPRAAAGEIVRSFLLPHAVSPDAVDAVLRDGTLTLTVDTRRRARVHVS